MIDMSIHEMMIRVSELEENMNYLESMKEYMDRVYQFDCCEQEFAYDCVVSELEETEEELRELLNILEGVVF
jgi:hypothetical protein